MKINFDVSRGRLTLVEPPSRGDRQLCVEGDFEQGDVLRAAFAIKREGTAMPFGSVVVDLFEGKFLVEIGDGFFDHDGLCVVGLTLSRAFSDGEESWSGFLKYGVLEFSPPIKSGEGELSSIALVRNYQAELDGLTAGASSVLFACDERGDIWRIVREGEDVQKTNLSSALNDKASREEVLPLFEDKADLSFVSNQLALKADALSLSLKADRSLVESLSLTLLQKADSSFVTGQLALKANRSVVLYDAESHLSALNLGKIEGVGNGESLSINFSGYSELVVCWQVEGSSQNLNAVTVPLKDTAVESTASTISVNPLGLGSPIKLFSAAFTVNASKTSITAGFITITPSTSQSAQSLQSKILKIYAR